MIWPLVCPEWKTLPGPKIKDLAACIRMHSLREGVKRSLIETLTRDPVEL